MLVSLCPSLPSTALVLYPSFILVSKSGANLTEYSTHEGGQTKVQILASLCPSLPSTALVLRPSFILGSKAGANLTECSTHEGQTKVQILASLYSSLLPCSTLVFSLVLTWLPTLLSAQLAKVRLMYKCWSAYTLVHPFKLQFTPCLYPKK